MPDKSMKTRKHLRRLLHQLERDLSLVNRELVDWNINYLKNAKKRYVHAFGIFSEYYTTGDILEVGSLPCHFTYCLKNLGYPVIGIDIEPERAEQFIAKHDLRIMKNDIETERIAFEDKRFSVIFFCEIIEHLRIDPISTLIELNRVLTNNGIMIVTTPNLYSINTIISFLRGRGINDSYREFEKLHSIGHMGHIRIYSTTDLIKLLQMTGFEIIEIRYKNYRRNRGKRLLFDLIYMLFPSLRPYQIIICRKVADQTP